MPETILFAIDLSPILHLDVLLLSLKAAISSIEQSLMRMKSMLSRRPLRMGRQVSRVCDALRKERIKDTTHVPHKRNLMMTTSRLFGSAMVCRKVPSS